MLQAATSRENAIPTAVVYCRHRKVLLHIAAHPSASSLPMKSLDHVEGYCYLDKFHQAISGLTLEFSATKLYHSYTHIRKY